MKRGLIFGGLFFGTASLALGWAGLRAPERSVPSAHLGSFDLCARYDGLPPQWLHAPRAGMRFIPAGNAQVGSERGYADERPLRHIHQAAFWIDATEVTNAQFAAFVAATGFVTDAERMGAGVVFAAPLQNETAAPSSWWRLQHGADWRHPEGPDSAARPNEPVVQVTRNDALAYAGWLDRDLPTEAEWESAAKAGRDNAAADASVLDAAGMPQANFWQGDFPFANAARDRYAGRSPTGCYAANSHGLHDMIGNVWEWTRDDYTGALQPHGHGDAAQAATSAKGSAAVIKGGSYLCAETFCVRYRASARHPQEADLPSAHVGFRTVLR